MSRTHVSSLTASLLLAIVLAACQAAPAQPTATPEAPAQPTPTADAQPTPGQPDEVVVGFSGPPLLDDFQIQIADGIRDRADELGVRLIHIEHDNDPVKQASDIEDLLAQNIDVLLLAAADAEAAIPSIDQADAQGIPVFTIDNASASDKVLNHSGNDLYCIGYRSLEYLSDQIGGQGKILHITGFAGMALVTWNNDGVQAYLDENPDIELVLTGYADWDPAEALAITEDVLLAHPDLDGIYVISEVMTQGPIQALAAQNLTDEVLIMSGGYAPESQEWLANGQIVGTFDWSGYSGAQEQMQRIYDYVVNGTQPPPFSPWPVTARPADGEPYEIDCPIGDWQP
jgi:ribose transport system substrate-binding protein